MKSIRTLKNLKGKKVIVRVDFNVPLKGKVIKDDFRIRKAIPTIKHILRKGGNVFIITHLGKDGSASIEPLKRRFFELSKAPKERVEFFENIRAFPGEEKNDPKFSKELAGMGDIYVNDAFSVSHREHASVVGIPKHIPHYAGLQLEEEIKNLSVPFKKPKRPFLFILGGAKFSTKMPLIKKYLKFADHVFIGGALLNDFLETKGLEVGDSLVDDTLSPSKEILNSKKLILPTDVVVKNEKTGKTENKKVTEVSKHEVILDVGRESIKILAPYIENAKLILWNGPLGKYEELGGGATKEVLKLVARSRAHSIIGGGDTVEVISTMKADKKFNFVSTGGGATLDFLATGTLPGIEALR